MAKRKRLTPAQPGQFTDMQTRAPETKAMTRAMPLAAPAPIAQVAGDASARAALAALADAVDTARRDGLMIEQIPLGAIDPRYLVRDRLEQDDDEMGALIDSLRARGQQTPIEVIQLPDPVDGLRYGLISGWRRLTALNRLYEGEKDDRFATVQARVITPETAEAAYVAMVEENEIRVNLSFYERARIALRAVREGVYPTPRTALKGLFGATTRSKRSKIGSFVPVVEALDSVLLFPTALPEKLGLALSRQLVADPGFAARLSAVLQAEPRPQARDELRLLSAALTPPGQGKPGGDASDAGPRPRKRSAARSGQGPVQVTAGVQAGFSTGSGGLNRIELTGSEVTPALYDALQSWLKAQDRSR